MTTSTSTSFVLKSIEVKNWKTFADATLNLKSHGLTGIVGQNGSGKSSFVDAIIWCLYGKRPKGVIQSSLRRRKSDILKDETRVTVTFTHAGQTIEVFRKMKGKNSTVTAGGFIDGKEIIIATGGTLETFVTNRLGMDEDGFKTAIVVPQKELDNLVDNVPSVRRAHIERLAGIEDMNLAVKKARDEENKLATQTKVLPGSQEDVDAAANTLDEYNEELATAEESFDNAFVSSTELKQALDYALEESVGIKDTFKQANNVYSQINSSDHAIQLNKNTIDSLQGQISDLENDVQGIDVTARGELESQYRSVNDEFNRINQALATYQGSVANADKVVHQLQDRFNNSTQRLNNASAKKDELFKTLKNMDSVDKLRSEQESIESVLEKSKARGSALSTLIDGNNESIDSIKKSLSNIDSHEHSGAECPTCHAPLPDPDALIEQFANNIATFSDEVEVLKATIKAKMAELKVVQSAIKDRENSERQLDTLEKESKNLTVEVSELEDELSLAKKDALRYEDFDIAGSHDALAKLDAEKRAIVSAGEKIAATEKLITRLDSLKEQKNSLQNQLTPAIAEVDKLNKTLLEFGDLNILEENVTNVDNQISDLRLRYDNAFRAMKANESHRDVLIERIKATQAVLEKEQALIAAKATALKRLEEKSAVSDLLDEYRKERVGRIAPELSETATDLISEMTNGRFVEVTVKEDFATYVTKDDGFEYLVSELSGGEKSVVALALRIAIGSLITGDNAGLLWLDEVLPAQDAGRRDAILGVLRSLPIQQIVMINHTHEAEDVVDQVVRISYDGTDSVITEGEQQ